MANVSMAEAKNRLPELVRRVEAGERVTITRRGRAVVDLKITECAGDVPFDKEAFIAEVRAELAQMTPSPVSGAELIRAMRDEGV